MKREIIVWRDSWTLSALDALKPHEPAWTQQHTGERVRYFVDTVNDEVFGYEARGRIFFDPADRARHDEELAAQAAARDKFPWRAALRRFVG